MAAPRFHTYIGIDYSGARTPEASLPGLRVYRATAGRLPRAVAPPAGTRKYWSRRAVAEWLREQLASGEPTIVGIDHAFSFPLAYFERHGVPHDWDAFLDDFVRHWPTHEPGVSVDLVRAGARGRGAARQGNSRWRRRTEVCTKSAKSVFHFDVQGQVAKSTHAGLPWLRWLRHTSAAPLHFWPYDGWAIPRGSHAVAEAYPRLWNRAYASEGCTQDEHDAYCIAAWLRRADRDGRLAACLRPPRAPDLVAAARAEGWILGV